jgi:4a-hydroxytetrahydrobiopterin dehydratase
MRLSEAEVTEALAGLAGWRREAEGKAIARGFVFDDFGAAFAFMTGVAIAAEKADHHPDWSNAWNKVEIALSTHSEGGITECDVALARTIDAFAARLGQPAPAA